MRAYSQPCSSRDGLRCTSGQSWILDFLAAIPAAIIVPTPMPALIGGATCALVAHLLALRPIRIDLYHFLSPPTTA